MALLLLLEPLKRLVGIHNIFQQALGASQKVFEYLDHEERIAAKPERRAASTRFERGIEFDRVSFPLSECARRFPHSRRSTWK